MSSMQSDARTLTRVRRLMASLWRAGRSMLVVVVFCLALVGFLHLTRGTAVQHVRGVATDGVPIGVSEPQFPLNLALAALSVGHGNLFAPIDSSGVERAMSGGPLRQVVVTSVGPWRGEGLGLVEAVN